MQESVLISLHALGPEAVSADSTAAVDHLHLLSSLSSPGHGAKHSRAFRNCCRPKETLGPSTAVGMTILDGVQ